MSKDGKHRFNRIMLLLCGFGIIYFIKTGFYYPIPVWLLLVIGLSNYPIVCEQKYTKASNEFGRDIANLKWLVVRNRDTLHTLNKFCRSRNMTLEQYFGNDTEILNKYKDAIKVYSRWIVEDQISQFEKSRYNSKRNHYLHNKRDIQNISTWKHLFEDLIHFHNEYQSNIFAIEEYIGNREYYRLEAEKKRKLAELKEKESQEDSKDGSKLLADEDYSSMFELQCA